MITNPHGRGVRMRAPALTAMSVAAIGAQAIAPASAKAQDPAQPAIKASMGHHVHAGNRVKVRGVLAGGAGRRVNIRRTIGHGWKTVARARTRPDGSFRASFPARRVGRMKVRVTSPGAGADEGKVTVYRQVAASWYGPGFYGHKLACGGTLSRGRIGVANKTMPCGTKVRIRYHGRSVTAPVIDRGPYVGGRTYDLTEATKARLRFAGTGSVWSSR